MNLEFKLRTPFVKRAAGRAFRLAGVLPLFALLSVSAHAGTRAPAPAKPRPNLVLTERSHAEFAKLPTGKRLKILVSLIRDGSADTAEKLLRATPFTGKFSKNRNLFILGMIERARGNLTQAAHIYRTVLASDPNLTMVRLELAATLHAMNQADGAKHHLELLKAAAPTTELSRNFGDFIAAIDSQRPWTFNAWVSLAPSTNFNNGTALEYHTMFGLTGSVGELSKKKSGIGIKGGTNSAYVFDLGRKIQAIVATGSYFEQYEGKLFDKTVLNQNFELRQRHKRGSLGFGMSFSEAFYKTTGTNGRPYSNEIAWSFGPQVTIRHLITRNLNLETRFSHRWNFFEVGDYADGYTTSLTNRLAYGWSAARVLYGMAGADRSKTDYKHTSTWAGWGGLGIYQEIPWGLTVYAEGKLRYSVSDGNYPFLFAPRENTRVDGRMVFTKRDFSFYGLAPQLEYTYARNFSNDELSRFESHGLAVTLTRAF